MIRNWIPHILLRFKLYLLQYHSRYCVAPLWKLRRHFLKCDYRHFRNISLPTKFHRNLPKLSFTPFLASWRSDFPDSLSPTLDGIRLGHCLGADCGFKWRIIAMRIWWFGRESLKFVSAPVCSTLAGSY